MSVVVFGLSLLSTVEQLEQYESILFRLFGDSLENKHIATTFAYCFESRVWDKVPFVRLLRAC